MPLRSLFTTAVLLCSSLQCAQLFCGQLHAQQPAAITTDPPPHHAAPAPLQSVPSPRPRALLHRLGFRAPGPGPHPVVLLLHGFPGNERNLDLAQTIRRAGWDVLFFDYRGSWGTPGDFSFTTPSRTPTPLSPGSVPRPSPRSSAPTPPSSSSSVTAWAA